MPTADHEVTDLLSAESIAARLAQIEAGEASAEHQPLALVPEVQAVYRYFDPLPNAADEYVRFATTSSRRVYTGIPDFDDAMRGIAPSEMLLVVGFAHSGKTLLTTEVLMANRERRVCFFTPDETRVLVLVKLACLVHGLSAEELEYRIAAGDETVVEMVRETASDAFPNLAVFDQSLTIPQMDQAIAETEAHWGAPVELLIFDYVDLLAGSGEDVPSKVNNLKAWGKRHDCPLIALHQSSRTAGADGKAVTISSGGYGGEQQATFLIGVRRKKNELVARIKDLEERIRASTKDTTVLEEQLASTRYDLDRHRNTVTLNLLKNKRPPSRLVEDVDFVLDESCGRITQLDNHMGVPARATTAYQRARAGVRWEEPTFGEDF